MAGTRCCKIGLHLLSYPHQNLRLDFSGWRRVTRHACYRCVAYAFTIETKTRSLPAISPTFAQHLVRLQATTFGLIVNRATPFRHHSTLPTSSVSNALNSGSSHPPLRLNSKRRKNSRWSENSSDKMDAEIIFLLYYERKIQLSLNGKPLKGNIVGHEWNLKRDRKDCTIISSFSTGPITRLRDILQALRHEQPDTASSQVL